MALYYSETYPTSVLGIILRATFLGRRRDWDWLSNPDGAARIRPLGYQELARIVPYEYRKFPTSWYYQVLKENPSEFRKDAAHRWTRWEASLLYADGREVGYDERTDYQTALMETHYAVNDSFMPDNYLVNNAAKISHLPVWIIHGKEDLICPIDMAYELKSVLPNASLQVIPYAAHAANEPGIKAALIEATKNFAIWYWSKHPRYY
ncbi:alpha/beta fold hydrolase [[Mycoplasma] testudinis]|uniref:alpha/beta fold hydrolase n=1 Tax=[Mycoplasma] testudinis TaxID=33924 RepID=UPI0006960FBE|nr:alpha/beta hydrolase [[Mycoplasma] testudinis]